MSKRSVLFIILAVSLIYPFISFYGMMEAFNSPILEEVHRKIIRYQLSIWISWVIFASVAVYFKWTSERNLFFLVTYVFLLIGFGIFGFFCQKMINIFQILSMFEDTYTMGVIVILQNLITAIILTIFLQVGVWWFTRRWHWR